MLALDARSLEAISVSTVVFEPGCVVLVVACVVPVVAFVVLVCDCVMDGPDVLGDVG